MKTQRLLRREREAQDIALSRAVRQWQHCAPHAGKAGSPAGPALRTRKKDGASRSVALAIGVGVIALLLGPWSTGWVSASEGSREANPLIEPQVLFSHQDPERPAGRRTELIIAQAPGMSPMGWDINLPGLDFATFEPLDADPRYCEAQCAREPQCGAWTYVHPGVQGPRPRCWLKYAIPRSVRDRCCVSGAKQRVPEPGSEPRMRLEPDLNLPGRDYADFDLPNADHSLCENECRRDPRCQAWTYVHPGVQGRWPRCWLKDAKPPRPIPDPCCVSGWKQ